MELSEKDERLSSTCPVSLLAQAQASNAKLEWNIVLFINDIPDRLTGEAEHSQTARNTTKDWVANQNHRF